MEKCKAAGMDDYMTKPYTVDALQAKIAQWTAPESAARDACGKIAADGNIPPETGTLLAASPSIATQVRRRQLWKPREQTRPHPVPFRACQAPTYPGCRGCSPPPTSPSRTSAPASCPPRSPPTLGEKALHFVGTADKVLISDNLAYLKKL